jgi:hypothetical protein
MNQPLSPGCKNYTLGQSMLANWIIEVLLATLFSWYLKVEMLCKLNYANI